MAGVMAANNSVFNKRLKMSTELAERVCMERLFHIVGAAIEKALEDKSRPGFWNKKAQIVTRRTKCLCGN